MAAAARPPAVLARGGDPPEPPAGLARGDDPPEPPAGPARGGDPPEPPAGLARGGDPPEPPAGLARGARKTGFPVLVAAEVEAALDALAGERRPLLLAGLGAYRSGAAR